MVWFLSTGKHFVVEKVDVRIDIGIWEAYRWLGMIFCCYRRDCFWFWSLKKSVTLWLIFSYFPLFLKPSLIFFYFCPECWLSTSCKWDSGWEEFSFWSTWRDNLGIRCRLWRFFFGILIIYFCLWREYLWIVCFSFFVLFWSLQGSWSRWLITPWFGLPFCCNF